MESLLIQNKGWSPLVRSFLEVSVSCDPFDTQQVMSLFYDAVLLNDLRKTQEPEANGHNLSSFYWASYPVAQ